VDLKNSAQQAVLSPYFLFGDIDPSLLSPSFLLQPTSGRITNKKQFLLHSHRLKVAKQSLLELSLEIYDLRVDPFEQQRVWMSVR
jgi:hypothetical protein